MWLNKQYHFDQVCNFNFKQDQILGGPLTRKDHRYLSWYWIFHLPIILLYCKKQVWIWLLMFDLQSNFQPKNDVIIYMKSSFKEGR
jgi:hypothetical protein